MRLSRIYTKKGDGGQSQLATGTTVVKDHLRLEAYGTVDELSCFLAQLYHMIEPTPPYTPLLPWLTEIQHELFDLGGELSFPENDPFLQKLPGKIADKHILRLEQQIDQMNDDLEPLKNFILPGGCPEASGSHVCRALSRRAERRLVTLMKEEKVREELLRYLNRLSDWFFVLSRTLTHRGNHKEILWEQNRS